MASAEESADRLFLILSEALSPDAAKRTAAEQALRAGEEQQDFFASLAMILAADDSRAPPQVRWLAAVVGKNAVQRSWRRRAKMNAVTEDERDFVRDTLLGCIGERTSTIATQITVWIAKIARMDFPKHWPNLLSHVCGILAANDVNATHAVLHALKVADEVFDVLASRRLLADRKVMYAASRNAFATVYALFNFHLKRMLDNDAVNADAARSSVEIVSVAMNCMRSLISHGFKNISDVREVHELYADVLRHPNIFLQGAAGGSQVQLDLSLLAVRTVTCGFERFPDEFQVFLPRFLEVYFGMFTAYNLDTAADTVLAEAAQFLRSVMQCPEYNDKPTASKEAGRTIMLSFFNEQRADALVHTMLAKVFVLRPVEVSSWMDDPESFVQDDEAAEWGTFSLRTQCESMFKSLLLRDKRRIGPKVISHAESVPASEPFLRDACYRAVGNAVRDLEGLFNFESWFQTQLAPILAAPVSGDMGSRIVQARAAWLVGQFAEQLTRESRVAVYGLLVNLLTREGGDRVVALSSVRALNMLVFDEGFVGGDFSPHVGACITACLKLHLESNSLALKRDQLELVTLLVKRCRHVDLLGVLPVLAEALPLVWQNSSAAKAHGAHSSTMGEVGVDSDAAHDEGIGNMVKTSVAMFLYELMKKLGGHVAGNQALYRFSHQVVEFGTNPDGGGGGLFLVEEACDLWQMLLAISSQYSAELHLLFARVPQILANDAIRLKDVSRVIQSYSLLGGEEFLRHYGEVLKGILQEALSAGRERGTRGRIAVAEIIDLLLVQFPSQGVTFLAPVLQFIFTKVTGAQEGVQSKVLSATYVALLATASLTNIAAVEAHIFEGQLPRVTALFDKLVHYLDLVYRREGKRTAVLALIGLSQRYLHAPEIASRVPLVAGAAVTVLANEFGEDKEQARRSFHAALENTIERHGEGGERFEEEACGELPEAERRKVLQKTETARKVRVGEAVFNLLGTLRSRDEAAYAHIVGQIGQHQMGQLEALTKLEAARYPPGAN